MATEVEERIVQMKFDNAQFEKGAKQSLLTLEKLDGVLDRLGQGGLDHLANTLDVVERRFSSFGIAGMAAIQKITNSAIDLGVRLMTAIPQQIISGGTRRANNIEQARFQLKGLGVEWDQVKDAMDYAVSGTAYGLDEAAKAAAQFAASKKDMITTADINGVTDMAKALRAISGVAAMTNSTYDEIANIFTGISGTGHVMTQDLRMLEGRGLNAAAKLAEVLSDGPENIKYTEEQIREMISKGEIDFLTFAKAMDYAFGEHATAANETYTGSLANMKAALSRIGADFIQPWHNGMIKIQNALRNTFNLARKVTQPFAEGHFTDWAERLSDIVSRLAGNIKFSWLENLLKLAGNAGDKILDVLEGVASAFPRGLFGEDKILAFTNQDAMNRYSKLQHTLAGIRVIFDSLKKIGKGVFENLFGGKSFDAVELLDKLLDKGKQFGDWIVNLKARNQGFAPQIQNAIEKITNVLSSAGRVIKSAFGVIFTIVSQVFSFLSGGIVSKSGTFLEKLADVVSIVNNKFADFLDKVNGYLQEHPLFKNSLETITSIFGRGVGFIESVTNAITNLIQTLFGLKEGSSLWSSFWDKIQSVWDKVSGGLSTIWNTLVDTLSGEGTGVAKIGDALSKIAGFFLAWRWIDKDVSPAIKRIRNTLSGFASLYHNLINIPQKLNSLMGSTMAQLRSVRELNQAKAIKELAISLLILAGALWVMASIPEDKLLTSIAILTGLMGALIGMFAALTAIMDRAAKRRRKKTKGLAGLLGLDMFQDSAQLIAISAVLISVGVAMLALAGALKLISSIDKDKMLPALGVFVVILAALAGLVYVLKKMKLKGAVIGQLLALSVFMIALAAAIVLIAVSMAIMSLLIKKDKIWTVIGLMASIFIALGGMIFFLSKMKASSKATKNILAMSAAMILISMAVAVIALAISLMSILIRKDKALTVIGLMASIFVALGGMIFFLSKMKINARSRSNILALAGIMAILAVIFVVMATALSAMSLLISNGKALTVIGLMASIFAALGGMIFILSKMKVTPASRTKILALAGIMAILAVIFVIMTAAFAVMSLFVNKNNALVLIGTMTAIFVALGGMIFVLSKMKITPAARTKVLALVGIIAILAVVMVVISAAMAVMSLFIRKDNALMVIGLMAGILAALGGMIFLLSKLKITAKTKQNVLALAALMLSISLAVVIMSVAVLIMSSALNKGNAIPVIASMVIMLGALAGLLFVISKIKFNARTLANIKTISTAFLILSASLVVMSIAFRIMSGIDMGTMITTSISLGIVVMAMAGAMAILNKANPINILAAALSMVVMAAAVVILAAAFKMMSSVEVTSLIPIAASLAIVLVAMAGSLAVLGLVGPMVLVGALAMLVLSGVLYILAGVFEKMSSINIDSLSETVKALAITLLAMAISLAILGAVGPMVLLGALAILIASGALYVMAAALEKAAPPIQTLAETLPILADGVKAFEGVNWDEIAKAFATLAGLSLGTLLMNPDKLVAAGPGLRSLGDGITALLPGLRGLDSLNDPGKVTKAVRSISIAAQTFATIPPFNKQSDVAAIATAISTIIPAIIDLNKLKDIDATADLMEKLGTSLHTFSTREFWQKENNVTGIGDALTQIVPAVLQLNQITDAEGMKTKLTILGEALQTFGTRSFWSTEHDITGIADALTKIVPAVLQLDQITDIDGMSAKLTTLGGAIEAFSTKGIFEKSRDLNPVGDGLLKISQALSTITDDQVSRLGQLATILMTDFGSGITGMALEIETSFSTMLGNMTTTITAYDATWVTLGGNITAGIANGIMSRTAEAASAMASMASSLATSFTVSMQINSPSRLMAKLAGYIPAGVAQGILGGSGEVSDAIITTMSPAMMVLMSLMNQDYDFSPTITPVVDLSNVMNAANTVNSMFGSADLSAGYNGHVSSIADYVGNLASEIGEVTNITNNTGDSYNFNIYASEGMDEEAIADAVMNRIRTTTVRRGAAFG